MRPGAPLAALALLAALLAGCSDGGSGEAVGTLAIGLWDDAPQELRLGLGGAYARGAPNGTWEEVAAPGGLWNLTGGGEIRLVEGEVPAGAYQGFRLLLQDAAVGGEAAVLAQTGIELGLPFTVPEGGRVQILLNLSWEDALYESAEGVTFDPVVEALELAGPGGTARLEAEDLASATAPPVARISVFDPTGLQAFASDFVADSPMRRLVATAGRLALSAGDSEAVEPGASLTGYVWDFGDGGRGEGSTVFHEYDLSGGNVTVRLTVTDSAGGSDSQSVPLALKPGTLANSTAFVGVATGLNPADCSAATPSEHSYEVVTDRLPDGTPGGLLAAHATLHPNGTAHALANLDLALADGGGAILGTSENGEADEEIELAFDPAAPPAGGSWSVQVRPCAALSLAYQGELTLTWQAAGEAAFTAWLAGYDDGHTHQH